MLKSFKSIMKTTEPIWMSPISTVSRSLGFAVARVELIANIDYYYWKVCK